MPSIINVSIITIFIISNICFLKFVATSLLCDTLDILTAALNCQLVLFIFCEKKRKVRPFLLYHIECNAMKINKIICYTDFSRQYCSIVNLSFVRTKRK